MIPVGRAAVPSVKRAAAAAAAAALLLAGCTGSGKPKTADPASSTATSNSPSPTASSTAASDPASNSPAQGSSAPGSDAVSPSDSSESTSAESSATESSPAPSPTADAGPVPAGPNAKFAGDPIAQSLLKYLVARHHALRAYDAAYEPMRAQSTALRHNIDKDYIQSLKDKQLAVQGEGYFVLERVRRLQDDLALAYLCEDDDQAKIVNRKTGALDEPVYNRWIKYELRMVREHGIWKVDSGKDGTFTCTGKLVP